VAHLEVAAQQAHAPRCSGEQDRAFTLALAQHAHLLVVRRQIDVGNL
jgi:hypothetical protein